MAKFVEGGATDAGALGAALDEVAEVVAVEVGEILTGEEGFFGGGVGTGGKVFPEMFFGAGAEVDEAAFVAFAVTDEELPFGIVVVV